MPSRRAAAANGPVIVAQVRGFRAMPEWLVPKPSESGAVLAPPSSVLAPPSNSIPAFILPFILPYTFPFFPAGEAGQSDGGSGAHRHPGGNR
jgi:hypothetical protein